jgi:hypothetical protein
MPEQGGCSNAVRRCRGTPHNDGSAPGCRRLAHVTGCGPVNPVRNRGVRRANTRPPGEPRSPMALTPATFNAIELGERCGSSPAGRRGTAGAGLRRSAGESQHGNQRRDLFRGGVALGDLDHGRPHRGMLPCLRCGEDARFERSMSRERMRIVRVSPGSMTSSTIPRSAAM